MHTRYCLNWLLAACLLSPALILAQPAPAKTAGTSLGSPEFVPTPEHPVGWRGDGTGRFPGATPPTSWERKSTGTGYQANGIIWAAPLPANGICTPIVVGQRIFVTTEPSDLVCLDKQTGKILWIRSNPEFDAFTDEQRQAIPGFAEKVAPLAQQMTQLNTDAAAELNAMLPAATTAAYQKPKQGSALARKKELVKQIQDALNAIDKKRFDHSWPQSVYGYATETPASDGKCVYAYFAAGGTSVCYDLDGNRRWIASGAAGGEEKGHFTSPLLLGNQFIVWGGPQLRAYDVESGKQLWTNAAKGANASSLYSLRAGDDLVAAFRNYFVRIRDGKPIWNSNNVENATTTPIVEGGLIYTWSGNPATLKAVSIPESTEAGKVTPKVTYKIDWDEEMLPKTKERPFDRGIIASPLYVDGLIYQISSGGGLQVHDAATGETVYRKLLPMKPRTEYWGWGGACASPALAGKYIYLLDNQGTTVIIEPGRQYKEVAVNHIDETQDGKTQVQNLACLVFDGTRMYYRSPGYLYCIGQ